MSFHSFLNVFTRMSNVGDDFSNTASLVEAVLTLQEQRDRSLLGDVPPPQPSSLPGTSLVENVAAATAAKPHVSTADSEFHSDDTSSAAAAGSSADANGESLSLLTKLFYG